MRKEKVSGEYPSILCSVKFGFDDLQKVSPIDLINSNNVIHDLIEKSNANFFSKENDILDHQFFFKAEDEPAKNVGEAINFSLKILNKIKKHLSIKSHPKILCGSLIQGELLWMNNECLGDAINISYRVGHILKKQNGAFVIADELYDYFMRTFSKLETFNMPISKVSEFDVLKIN